MLSLSPEKRPDASELISEMDQHDTREDKDAEDLLRSGALKAHQIARELGQPTQAIKKQLYSMEKKGQERFVLGTLFKILTVVI